MTKKVQIPIEHLRSKGKKEKLVCRKQHKRRVTATNGMQFRKLDSTHFCIDISMLHSQNLMSFIRIPQPLLTNLNYFVPFVWLSMQKGFMPKACQHSPDHRGRI